MSDVIEYVIRGLPFGCVFALVGIGLVLAYRTSGVFNLGLGAQAFCSAAVFYELRAEREWPLAVAFVVAALLISPAIGLVLERFVFRWLRTAPAMARLVATMGVLVALPALVKIVLGSGPSYAPPVLWPDATAVVNLGRYSLNAADLAILTATAVLVSLLFALFRFSSFGLIVRAVVESPRLTGLTGVNTGAVSASAWVISSAFAGTAGVLISPLFAQVSDSFFFNVLVAAIAVAAFGRLKSIAWTLVGGLLLGAAQGVLAGVLPANSVLSNGLRPSLPFLALFAILVSSAELRQRDLADPLAGVDPPIGTFLGAGDETYRPSRKRTVITTIALGLLAAVLINIHYPQIVWSQWLVEGAVFSVIFLSITVFTGMGGQLSLCQATFAAIGAFTTAQLATSLGVPVLVAAIAGAVLAAVVGALLAIPTRRLSGLFLALATLAFAFMFQSIIQPLSWVSGGGPSSIVVPRPLIGPFELSNNLSFFWFALLVAIVVAFLVRRLQKGTTGMYLQAVRGSETGAQSLGIDSRRARIIAFALAAAIAGLGGGMLAMFRETARPQDFEPLIGLLWVASVVTLGARSIEGAINASLGISAFGVIFFNDLIPWAMNSVQPWHHFGELSLQWLSVLFGLGAISYAKNPDGILAATRRSSARRRARRFERRQAALEPVEAAA